VLCPLSSRREGGRPPADFLPDGRGREVSYT